MINDIVIIIWEDHLYDQESLVIYKNTIVKSLIIYLEPVDIIICFFRVYTLILPVTSFCHGDLNLNKLGGIFFINIW